MELIRDNWTKNDYDDFVEELRSYADEKYRSFHSSLIPDNESRQPKILMKKKQCEVL